MCSMQFVHPAFSGFDENIQVKTEICSLELSNTFYYKLPFRLCPSFPWLFVVLMIFTI